MTRRRNRATGGFTLVELIVAAAITGLVAAMAYGFLSSASTAREQTDQALETVEALETVFQLLATDLDHMVERELPSASAGVGSARRPPAFMGGNDADRGANYLLDDYVLRFSRGGWANPLDQTRSDLQRVGYRWRDGELWRDYWPERNQPLDEEPAGGRLLMEDLESLRLRFLPADADDVQGNDWISSWPPPAEAETGESEGPPLALEITLTVEDLGDVRRIFPLPGV